MHILLYTCFLPLFLPFFNCCGYVASLWDDTWGDETKPVVGCLSFCLFILKDRRRGFTTRDGGVSLSWRADARHTDTPSLEQSTRVQKANSDKICIMSAESQPSWWVWLFANIWKGQITNNKKEKNRGIIWAEGLSLTIKNFTNTKMKQFPSILNNFW